MIKEDKILNGYIIKSRVLDLNMWQIAAADTMDEIKDKLIDLRIDVADLVRKEDNASIYTDDIMESCYHLKTAIKYFNAARDAYRRALQEYLGNH